MLGDWDGGLIRVCKSAHRRLLVLSGIVAASRVVSQGERIHRGRFVEAVRIATDCASWVVASDPSGLTNGLGLIGPGVVADQRSLLSSFDLCGVLELVDCALALSLLERSLSLHSIGRSSRNRLLQIFFSPEIMLVFGVFKVPMSAMGTIVLLVVVWMFMEALWKVESGSLADARREVFWQGAGHVSRGSSVLQRWPVIIVEHLTGHRRLHLAILTLEIPEASHFCLVASLADPLGVFFAWLRACSNLLGLF